VFPCALLVLGWQVWTVVDRAPSTFLLSYWFVTWDHGFLRRGLSGEINQWLFPGDLLVGAQILRWAPAVVSAGCVAVVAVALLRRGTPVTVGLGWLLIVSPFTVKALLVYTRPDQFAIVLLPLVALVWRWWPRRPTLPLLLLGLGFSTLVLIHEGIVLTVAPWLLLLIVHFSRGEGWRTTLGRVAALFSLPALTTVVVLWRGRASPEQIEQLRANAPADVESGSTIFDNLGDSVVTSVRSVLSYGVDNLAAMVLVGLALWAVHLVALYCVPGLWRRPTRRVLLVLAGAVLPALATELLIAIDWQRWFALWLGLGLITYAVVLLAEPAAPPTAPQQWPRRTLAPFVVLCVLLTLVPVSTANNKLPCSVSFLVQEAPQPFQRVVDAVTGRNGSDHHPKCSDDDWQWR